MVSSSAAPAIHRASFRAFRNLAYNGGSNVNQSELKCPHYPLESLGQVIEGQVRRGIESGGWRALGSRP